MTPWQPILTGGAAEQALEAVAAIAADLSYPADSPWKVGLERDVPHSLGYGNAGMALFFCYLGECLQNDAHAETARLFLNDAVVGMDQERMPYDLFQGISGICWAYEHLAGRLPVKAQREDRRREYDTKLLDWCRAENTSAALADGISGVCLYAAEMRPEHSANTLSSAVTHLLANTAEPISSGVAWRVSQSVVSHIRKHFPAFAGNVYSMSVAHGTAGIVGGLLATCNNRAEGATCIRLIERAIAWMLANRHADDSPHFPVAIGTELPRLPAVPNGWYVGDPGVFTVLFNAGVLLDRQDWKAVALQIARLHAGRPLDGHQTENNDFTLNHGWAGLAHLYNRLFHATGDELFADAARYWYTKILNLRDPQKGIGGFSLEDAELRGFLRGAAGLGLALLAAIHPVEPAWDRALLASFGSLAKHSQPESLVRSVGN